MAVLFDVFLQLIAGGMIVLIAAGILAVPTLIRRARQRKGQRFRNHRSLAMNSSIGIAGRVWILILPLEPSSMDT